MRLLGRHIVYLAQRLSCQSAGSGLPQLISPGCYLMGRPGRVLIAGTVCGRDAASARPRDGRKARPGGQYPGRPHGHAMP